MTNEVVVRAVRRVAKVSSDVTGPLTTEACGPIVTGITTVIGLVILNAEIGARVGTFDFVIYYDCVTYHLTLADRYEFIALTSYLFAMAGRMR